MSGGFQQSNRRYFIYNRTQGFCGLTSLELLK